VIRCESDGDLPQLTVCKSCNTVLFDGPEMEEPIETIRRYNGTCPGCGKALTYDVANVRIFPLTQDQTEQYPTSWGARSSPIRLVDKQPMGTVSRRMPKPMEKPVPLAVWLRRRNSATEESAEYEPGVSGPKDVTSHR